MSAQNMLSPQEHERIADAIRAAERRTSGEIYCVLARRSDSYAYPALFTLTVILLGLSLLAAVALRHLWIEVPAVTLAAAQIAAFACACLAVAALPALRPRLVPKGLRYRRAHDNARKQFLVRNIHLTERRTGVLIFVSLAERYAEIVADSGIDAHVDQREWDDTVRDLAAGAARGSLCEAYVEAIAKAGGLLARHFPPTPANPNELDDRLAEI